MKPPAGIRHRKRNNRSRGNQVNCDQLLENAVESDIPHTSATSAHGDNQRIDLATKLEEEGDGSQDELTSLLSSRLALCDSELMTESRKMPDELRSVQSSPSLAAPTKQLHQSDAHEDDTNYMSSYAKRSQTKSCRRFPKVVDQFDETDSDHEGDAGRSRDDDVDEDSDYRHDYNRLVHDVSRLRIKMRVDSDGGDSSSGTILPDHHSSTGYNADESLSPPCADSDDKSSSTTSLYCPPDKRIFLRPRMRATIATTRGELVPGGDKLESDIESDSCNCRGVQDQRFVNDVDSSLLSRLGAIEKDHNNNSGKNENNSHKACCIHKNEHHLGRRPSSFRLSSQQEASHTSAKCSEYSGWFSILLRIPSYLRSLVIFNRGVSTLTASRTTGRRRSRHLSALELKEYKSGSRLSDKRASNESLESVEWQTQQSQFSIGNNQISQSNMPDKSNYGRGRKYQPLIGANGGRRMSGSIGRSRPRDSTRFQESNSYIRLGKSYYHNAPEPSIFQEYASRFVWNIQISSAIFVL